MIKKTISYENFDGKPETEDIYLNINKAELIALEIEADKPLGDMLKEVGETPSAKEVLQVFKLFLQKGYGVKSVDGKKLLKSQTIWEEFEGSEPYSELLWEMLSTPSKAVDIITGMLPKQAIEEMFKKNPEQKKQYDLARAQLSEAEKILEQQANKNDEEPAEATAEVEAMPEPDSNNSDQERLEEILKRNPDILNSVKVEKDS